MNESDRIEMMRALAGELPADEREGFERKLAADEALQTRLLGALEGAIGICSHGSVGA
jgi:anti-sigma factor RsiW